MKKMLAVVAVALFASASLANGADVPAPVAKAANEFLSAAPDDGYLLPADKLLERIKGGKDDFVLLDVRVPKEKTYDQGHLPGAIHIGFKDVAKPENLARLPKDKDIIIYCNTGHEENKVLTVLRMLGYRAYALKWGYMSWKTAPPTGLTLKAIETAILNNYPVEK